MKTVTIKQTFIAFTIRPSLSQWEYFFTCHFDSHFSYNVTSIGPKQNI